MDKTNGYLYITVSDATSSNKGYIAVINPPTLYSKKLITDLKHVFGLVLYPSKGQVY